MRWPCRRRRDDLTTDQAREAKQRAAADLAAAHERAAGIASLSAALREAKERNHFGEALTASFERRR